MGMVFVFLTLLVLGTMLMSRLILAWSPASGDSPVGSGDETARIAAVVAAAVRRYRADHGG